jgi:hypothetical protein
MQRHNAIATSVAVLTIIIVIVVATIAFALVSQGTSLSSSTSTNQTSNSGSTTTNNSSQPCAQSLHYPTSNQTTYSNGTVISETAYPVFTMTPASTMTICVNYGSHLNNGYSGSTYNSVYTWESGGQLQPDQSITTSASTAILSLALGQNTDVEYTVAAAQNVTGFFGLTLLQLCTPVPFTVGVESSQINASDFPGLLGSRSCPAQFLSANIVGYTGASVTYIKFESSFTITNSTTVSPV